MDLVGPFDERSIFDTVLIVNGTASYGSIPSSGNDTYRSNDTYGSIAVCIKSEWRELIPNIRINH